jgi:hypothetical protein
MKADRETQLKVALGMSLLAHVLGMLGYLPHAPVVPLEAAPCAERTGTAVHADAGPGER